MGFTPSAPLETLTLNRWFKEKVEPIFRKSSLMARFQEKGAILYGAKATGKRIKWVPKVRRQSIYTLDAYNVQHEFPVPDQHMTVTLPMCAYGLGAKITKFDRLANMGSDTQIYDLVQETVDGLAEDFVEDFGSKLYLEGNATGSKDLHGLESFFSQSGLLSGGFVGTPDGTYAGVSQVWGALGGSWTGTFPDGQGDVEYCAWSPLVIDYANAVWDQVSGNTWAADWQQVLNAALAYLGRLQKIRPDTFLTSTSMMRQMEDSLIGSQQVLLESTSKLVDAGFNVRKFKGVDVIEDYDCGDAVGYLLNFDNLALLSMQNQLVAYEEDMKIETSEQLHAADFYGQMRCWAPSRQCKVELISGGT